MNREYFTIAENPFFWVALTIAVVTFIIANRRASSRQKKKFISHGDDTDVIEWDRAEQPHVTKFHNLTDWGISKNESPEVPPISKCYISAHKATTNRLGGIMSGRPNLSPLTILAFKNRGHYNHYRVNCSAFDKSLLLNAELRIPELIQIAEMYFDSMVGKAEEKSIPFLIVRETLNDIANIK